MDTDGKIMGARRQQALGMDKLMRLFLRSNNLTARLNTQRVFDAWDEVSGVRDYTLNKFYRDGKLFVTVSSSMVRSHLEFQKPSIVEAINDFLRKDSLFDSEYSLVGFVEELIIR